MERGIRIRGGERGKLIEVIEGKRRVSDRHAHHAPPRYGREKTHCAAAREREGETVRGRAASGGMRREGGVTVGVARRSWTVLPPGRRARRAN